MSGVTLNDVVVEWGSHNGANAYNPAKDRLTAGMSQDEVAAFAGATNWNDGLRYLAQGPPVLQEAVLLLDASFSDAGEPRVINRGTGGTALDAKYGSVLGAYVYDGAFVSPLVSIGNALTVPHSAGLNTTGDLELVVRLSLTDWTVTNGQYVVGRYGSAGSRSWLLEIMSTGNVRMFVSPDGTTATGYDSGVTTGFSDGETGWLKVTLEMSGSLKVYVAPDQPTEPTAWTLRGSSSFAPTSMFQASTPVYMLGSLTGTFGFPIGSLHRTIVRDGIDGTTVLDVDLANVADYATSFTATTGQTVTVNSTSSDTNDPLLLTHTGENYVYLPGTVNNYLQVASIPAGINQLESFEYTATGIPTARPSTTIYYISSATSSSGGGGWSLIQYATGGLAMITHTGSVFATTNSSEVLPLDATGIRASLPEGGDMAFEYQVGDGPWTQLGSAVTPAGLPGPGGTPSLWLLNNQNAAQWVAGSFTGELVVKDAPDGDVLFHMDCATDITDAGATSFTATSGQTVTVNRATSGRKTALVTRPVWLFGTDDFLEVADNALLDFGAGDDFTVLAVSRSWNTAITNSMLVSKMNNLDTSGAGWSLYQGAGFTAKIAVTDGTVIPNVNGIGPSAGVLTLYKGIRNVGTDTIGAGTNNSALVTTTDTTTGSLSNALPMRVGRLAGSAGNYADSEIVAVAVFRRVLTADEIAAINTYYGTI